MLHLSASTTHRTLDKGAAGALTVDGPHILSALALCLWWKGPSFLLARRSLNGQEPAWLQGVCRHLPEHTGWGGGGSVAPYTINLFLMISGSVWA